MTPKQIFSNDIIRIIHELCGVVFNITANEKLHDLFGISNEQTVLVVNRLVAALPSELFVNHDASLKEEIKNICAREFIFFQVQEKWNDPQYQQNLENFIHIFSKDIQQKINIYKKHESREER